MRFKRGNAAAMREALDATMRFLGNLEIEPYSPLDEDVSELRQRIMDAIYAPPRNCDVGTAEEQAKRFNDFCSTHTCNKCVVYDKMAHSFNDGIPERAFSCRLVFSQLPYEAEEGATK